MSFLNDRVLITGDLRRQTIGQDNYDPTTGVQQSSIDQQAITPLAGIVVKPQSNISVFRGLRMMASATFYDPKVSGTAGGTQDGNDPGGVPKFAFNLGVDYDLPWVAGLSVNGRIIHTGAQYYDSSDALRLPAWTRYDVGGRYGMRIAQKDVVFRANIENLFGIRYWIQQGTYVMNAAPRTLLLSAKIDF